MNVLCIGDVVGAPGVAWLRHCVPRLRRQHQAQAVIVNAENADKSGTGLPRQLAVELLREGFADVLTTGNHCFRRADATLYEEWGRVLCPANFPGLPPGCGSCVLDLGRVRLEVYNLQGTAFLEALQNPFTALDDLLRQSTTPLRVLDFHAEATAEKKALAFYADGRLSALFGTHTHVPTADEQILPGGTGYITDVGMTGPTLSVLGVKPEIAVQRQKLHRPVHFEVAEGPCALEGALFTLDERSGHCTAVRRVREVSDGPVLP